LVSVNEVSRGDLSFKVEFFFSHGNKDGGKSFPEAISGSDQESTLRQHEFPDPDYII
jgi:hypothetical protein